MTNTMMPPPTRLRLGSAWYPEHYGQGVQREDLARMRELGFDAVRVGEFAWARFEPEEGRFDTAWMAAAMDLAHAHGIGVILCTPTASAPAWMLHSNPELGYVDPNGYRHGKGGRQAADYCNPQFQERSRAVTEAVARDLGRHPAVIGWQTDNELRGHQKLSLSPSALAGWHRWLERRFGDIEALNRAWGTDVWSNRYLSFDQVPGPHPLPNYCHSHSLLTTYRRYMDDVAVEFQRAQVAIIRRHSAAPISHNSEDSVDEWELTRDLDVAGHDCYVGGRPLADVAMRMDIFRNLKPGRRFWLLETDADGDTADGPYPVGFTANTALLAYASGAELVSYWPWRTNRSGAEIVAHGGILAACGRKTHAWEPAVRTAALRKRLEPLLATFSPAPAQVAFIRSERHGHHYYIDRIAGLEPEFDFRGRLGSHYRTLQEIGAWRDVLHDQAEIAGRRLVVSPYLPYTSTGFLARMRDHLAAGGVWIVGPYTGYLSEHHTNHADRLFGDLEGMLGIDVPFFRPVRGGVRVRLADGTTGEARMHAAVFTPGAEDEVLGTYAGERFEGEAWGLRKRIGGGTVYVLGSELGDEARRNLYRAILAREGVPVHALPDRVLRIPQVDRDGRHAWVLINANRTARRIVLPSTGTDLLTGEAVGPELDLQGTGQAFVRFDNQIEG